MLKDFDYQKMYDLCREFSKIPKQQREIFDFLWTDIFEGSFSDLTRALGQPVKNAPNIRKAVKELENRCLVNIVYEQTNDEEKTNNALQVLLDKGIDIDKAESVLQDFGFTIYGEDYPENEPKRRKVKAIYIVDNWMNNLLNNK